MLSDFIKNNSNSSRIERKYIYKIPLYYLINYIKYNPIGLKEIYYERNINNIYLDSRRYTNFYDNLIGCSKRIKPRIRWYGNLENCISPTLELKYKENLLGYKSLFSIKNFNLFDFDVNVLIDDNKFPDILKHYLKDLIYVLINSYTRRYFETFDGKIRITVDYNMKYYRQFFKNNFRTPKIMKKNDFNVIEIKYFSEYENIVSNILQYFPSHLYKNSKYINGMIGGI